MNQKQQVINRLREYLNLFNELMFSMEILPLKGQKKCEAQQTMKYLKQKLKDDCNKVSLNDLEKYSFCPAIQEASAGIQVAWDSDPSIDWARQVYNERKDFRFLVGELEG